MTTDIHAGQPILQKGVELAEANAVMIMLHGRGASARDILALTEELEREDVAYLAPQAAGDTWYPYSFLVPLSKNEPHLSSALTVLDGLVAQVNRAGFPHEKIMLLGFSQGACLALEYAARNAKRYGAVFGLSGGLIGPDDAPRTYPGSLAGTPILLGCSDVDFHIPKKRVIHSADVLRALGADVDARLYAGMGHTINEDEFTAVRDMMEKV